MNNLQRADEYRRYRAVELMERGEPKDLISRILGVSLVTLNKWQERSRRGEDLNTKISSGRPRTISDEQLTELSRLLSEGAVAHGWENNLWTSARVREVIKKHFGLQFSRWHVWVILTSYLGWTARRPVLQTKRRDEVAIERWKANDLHRIVLDLEERGDHLVFIDETGFMMTPTIRRTFAAPGVTPINKVSDPHGRISVIAAVSISPKRKHLGWHYHLLNDNTNFRGPSVVEFLESLAGEVGNSMTIIWDSILIHWSDVVAACMATHPRIVSEFFPPYAPELNPVDRAWFYIKYDRLANFTPATTAQLRSAVRRELEAIKTTPRLLRSFIHHSGLPLDF
jgi:transposase